jgi:arginine-tRNA-protein transferase
LGQRNISPCPKAGNSRVDPTISNGRPKNGMSDSSKSKHHNEFDLLHSVHTAEYDVLRQQPRPDTLEPDHKFTLELDSNTLTDEKYALYVKYQIAIHHESGFENTPEQFKRFLCSSPLTPKSEDRRLGSYHQLYRIDGILVAIAVVDFLPDTISSVYFIYDPEKVGKFGMGKISALREVAMCIEGNYKYYGLGISQAMLM